MKADLRRKILKFNARYVTTTLHLTVAIAQFAAGVAASDVEMSRPVGQVTTG
jgi:hypothetical protein